MKHTRKIKDLHAMDLKMDWKGTVHHFYRAIFLQSFHLRMKYPSIYFEQQTFSMEIMQQFMSITRPPFLIFPKEIFFPHGAGRDITIAVAIAYDAFNSYALSGIAEDTNFYTAIRFARKKVYNSNMPFINDEEISARILTNFGSSVASKLNESLSVPE